jgi:trehalose 6-phosphate phosphatase
MNARVTSRTPPALGEVLRRFAVFLDFDGTLVEIAPTPDAVRVDPSLPAMLTGLHDCLGGALAIVSGRPLATLDALLAPACLPAACEHGAVLRVATGGTVEAAEVPAVPEAWRRAAAALAASVPGAVYEAKPHGFALHARQAPAAMPRFEAALSDLIATDDRFLLLPAHMAWEVKPRAVDKGTAVATLMARAPFRGRTPLFVGDDVTDEAAIAAAEALGGVGLRVAETFGDPAGVRAWLAHLHEEGCRASAA